MSEANPFEAGADGVRRGPPTPPAVLRAFAVQRGFRLLVLPALLGVITLFARQDLALPAWSILVVTAGSADSPSPRWACWRSSKCRNCFCHCDGCDTVSTCTAVTLYSGQLVAQSELSVVITLAPLPGWWKVV